MATLNLGQQCLALARTAMSKEEEDLIKSAGSMSKIRKVIESQVNRKFLTHAIRQSLSEPIKHLREIYERCVFAGKTVRVHRAATDDEVEGVQDVCLAQRFIAWVEIEFTSTSHFDA